MHKFCARQPVRKTSVSRSSTINVKHVVYSVPSRLVGQLLRVRLWDDRLSCYVGSSEVMSCPRARPEKGKTRARRIDFRHVIDSLAKKPGAFCHATLRNDILPDRLIHHGYMFELKGESYRKKTAKAVPSAT